MTFIYGLGIGLLIGGAVAYYFYARLKGSLGAITSAADAIRKSV